MLGKLWAGLAVHLAAVLAGGCATAAGDVAASRASSTTTSVFAAAPTSTTAVALPIERPDVAGLFLPPEGFSQARADIYAADFIEALAAAGWHELDDLATYSLVQHGMMLSGLHCHSFDRSVAQGPAAVDEAVHENAAALSRIGEILIAEGSNAQIVREIADDLHRAMAAAGKHLCPEHADLLREVARLGP